LIELVGEALTAVGMVTCLGAKKASLLSQYRRAAGIDVLVSQ
jgi:hypothetical protein